MKQSSEPKIIVNGLVKSFGNLEVLKGINAEIDKGEVICGFTEDQIKGRGRAEGERASRESGPE